MIPRRPEDGPFHARHKCQPNTDPALVAEFMAANRMHACGPYGATITAAECIKRRSFAFSVPRNGYHHSTRSTWRSDVFMSVERCVKCKDYARREVRPVPAKYGACECGKEGRLVSRGKCSSCYQRYLHDRRVKP